MKRESLLSPFDDEFGPYIESLNGHIYALIKDDEHVAVLTITVYDDETVNITLLYVFENYRRQMIAQSAMTRIKTVLDTRGIKARLCPDPQSKCISREQLVTFYKSFGFHEGEDIMWYSPSPTKTAH
jgi:GNAT superfamily N-acetyltransferase